MRARAIALSVVLSLVAVSCGDVTPESLAYATSTTEPTVLRLATPRIAGFEEVIADWEREHPTAKVDVVVRNIDDHHRSILDDAGAGGQFDLIAFDATYGADIRARPELFVDIASLDAPPVAGSFLDARWSEGVADSGELIGIPLDVDSTALLVRTDLVNDRILSALRNAESWCDVLIAGDEFSDETNTAFLSDTDDLVSAILAQSRTTFVDENGTVVTEARGELERAFDLAMIALGEGPLHGEPCDDVDEVQRISRNLEFDTPDWRSELRDSDFAAVIAPWSFRQRISNAAPETAGVWTTVGIPIDDHADGSPSEGGLHLSIPADAPQVDLAYDLLLTLTNSTIQEVAFAGGSGPLPSALDLHTNGVVARPTDGFFVDATLGSTYSNAALGRPTELGSAERRVVIAAMLDAVNRVETAGRAPDEAWTTMLEDISDSLG